MQIKTSKRVPNIYSRESRDFQLFGHLYDSVFNDSKASIDSMLNAPISNNTDLRFLELAAKTIGFDSKHSYTIEDLIKLCQSFKSIIRKKGTSEALLESLNLLRNAQNNDEETYFRFWRQETLEPFLQSGENEPPSNSYFNVDIYVPESMSDLVLFEDMLDYILPAGFTYSIFLTSTKVQSPATDKFGITDSITVKTGPTATFGRLNRKYTDSSVAGAGKMEDVINNEN